MAHNSEVLTSDGLPIGSPYALREMLRHALLEDIGSRGDVTTLATTEAERQAEASFIVKAPEGIISGLSVAREVFALLDPHISMVFGKHDGDRVYQGDVVASVFGQAQAILTGERTALEFVRRMSGIATETEKYVKAVKGTGAIILDTRKTMPGWRDIDKQAVLAGGGQNHRRNLSEMGLIKNNHIDLVGGDVSEAIRRFRAMYPEIPLEVEVRNVDELSSALRNLPDRILLDNMTTRQMQEAVKIRDEYSALGKKVLLEASGNIILETVRQVAKTGVEYISVGSLTHSVRAFDISLHITFVR